MVRYATTDVTLWPAARSSSASTPDARSATASRTRCGDVALRMKAIGERRGVLHVRHEVDGTSRAGGEHPAVAVPTAARLHRGSPEAACTTRSAPDAAVTTNQS